MLCRRGERDRGDPPLRDQKGNAAGRGEQKAAAAGGVSKTGVLVHAEGNVIGKVERQNLNFYWKGRPDEAGELVPERT